MRYPKHLEKMIAYLKMLPGVGFKTAERFAFHLLSWPEETLTNFSKELGELKKELLFCQECGALMENEKCPFCTSSFREKHKLCILSSARDIFLIEKTKSYQGLYHVIESLLSPLEGKTPGNLNIEKIKKRIELLEIKEVILALDSTLEGDTTSLYIKKMLSSLPIKTYRLAFGLPVGSSLEYIDGSTLTRALAGKQVF